MKNLGLIPKLIIAIILGLLIGTFMPKEIVSILATFNSIFGNFLGFIIPLIILGFVVCGIADLGGAAGKMLGLTTLLAYGSTLISGFLAFFISSKIFPSFIKASISFDANNPEHSLLAPIFKVDMPPVMSVMSALILAFLLGLGIASIKGKTLYNMCFEFQEIIQKVIKNIIIPLIPIHILGIFANMTYAGEVKSIFSVFWKVFLIIILIQFGIILFQFTVAGALNKKNIFKLLKNQISGYLTALGTQSSAATIPVNLDVAEKNGVSKGVREFVIPLCATIHLSGSTITLTCCSIAVMLLNNMPFSFATFAGFIAMLGITMVAAPGVPGGAVMAALGVLQSNLGFSEAQLALMIALYIAQDSFGTACNISGDNAIALIVDKFKFKNK
ncbi:sodium:proton antiporter [Clostridium baratii]|uniref:Sodium:dicarboxylate symporter family protein n=1 Tax=Clostridium baratii TaxID=1561 RepID=A0A174ULF6_9CLOT|nr:dicarboxylate/amino acid:cation symporter [Clostridium baratii]OPF52988.1 sodium:proton antiporter [Clostridium baratii]OPF53792.1 sodium:proton antiporter [Clostridium baratii]OPF54358.1 sodium:proton antiporter [Clostridium baratii]OPF60830.1 sodium:proton antiporter [Clostridium baratii]CUQ22166.1 sodium:dicarboxylate symporter family protein [Clostridium baratii]